MPCTQRPEVIQIVRRNPSASDVCLLIKTPLPRCRGGTATLQLPSLGVTSLHHRAIHAAVLLKFVNGAMPHNPRFWLISAKLRGIPGRAHFEVHRDPAVLWASPSIYDCAALTPSRPLRNVRRRNRRTGVERMALCGSTDRGFPVISRRTKAVKEPWS